MPASLDYQAIHRGKILYEKKAKTKEVKQWLIKSQRDLGSARLLASLRMLHSFAIDVLEPEASEAEEALARAEALVSFYHLKPGYSSQKHLY